MAAAANVDKAFEQYAKFGKTEAQVKEMKGGLRIETRNIQKLMKESGIIDAKYTTQLLDTDISRVIGKLTQSNAAQYPKGTLVVSNQNLINFKVLNLNTQNRKTLERAGFVALLNQIAESKKQDAQAIFDKVNSVSGPSTAGTTVSLSNFQITLFF